MAELKYWRSPYPLTGNAYFYGRVGSGKSWKLVAMAQSYHSLGYKVWDMFGGKRGEGPFWCFPSEEKKLWFDFEQHVGPMKNPGPKKYRVNLYYPLMRDSLPNRLPEKLPRITAKVFTIPISSITADDIALVIGNVASNSRYVWNTIRKECGKDGTSEDISLLLKTKLKKYAELKIVKAFIKPLLEQGLLSNDSCELNIDISEESKDKESIMVLNLDFVEETFKFFIMGYINRRILAGAMDGSVHKRNIGLYRESSLFMKVTDKNAQAEETTSIFRNQISEVARYARSGYFLFLDTQSPCLSGETKIIVNDKVVKIKDLPKDFVVNSFNISKNKEELQKAEMWEVGEKEVYEIELEDGEKVIATGNHRFYDENKQEVYVEELKEGDKILCL